MAHRRPRRLKVRNVVEKNTADRQVLQIFVRARARCLAVYPHTLRLQRPRDKRRKPVFVRGVGVVLLLTYAEHTLDALRVRLTKTDDHRRGGVEPQLLRLTHHPNPVV